MFGRLSIAGLLRLMLIVIAAGLIGIQTLRWEQRTVFVFANAVEPGTSITAEMLSTASFPKAASFPGLVDDPAAIVGSVAAVAIPANIPLQRSFFSARCNPVGLGSDPNFPYATLEDLPKRKYAFPIDLRQTAGLVGLGDYVDIAWRPPAQGGIGARPQFLLQRVHIVGLRAPDGTDAAINRGGGISLPFGGGGAEVSHIVIALTVEQLSTLEPLNTSLIYVRADANQPLMPDVPIASTSYTQTCAEEEEEPVVTPSPSPGASGEPSPSPSSPTDSTLPSGWKRVTLVDGAFSVGMPKDPAGSTITGSAAIGSSIATYRAEAVNKTIFEVATGTATETPASIAQIQALLKLVIDEQAERFGTTASDITQAQIAGRTGFSFRLAPAGTGGSIGSGRVAYTSEGRWILWVVIAPPGNSIGLAEESYLASARIEVQ